AWYFAFRLGTFLSAIVYTPPLSDLGAALLADADLLAVGQQLVSGPGGLVALGADALHLAGVDGGFLLDDAALIALLAGLGVAGDHVDLLHDDLALLGHDLQDLALLALVLTGQDDDGIVLANAHLIHVFSYPLTALR